MPLKLSFLKQLRQLFAWLFQRRSYPKDSSTKSLIFKEETFSISLREPLVEQTGFELVPVHDEEPDYYPDSPFSYDDDDSEPKDVSSSLKEEIDENDFPNMIVRGVIV
jgi:hypothetical protein